MQESCLAVARVGALLVVYHTDTTFASFGKWRKRGAGTHGRMRTDNDGVESFFLSTDYACSAPPEPLLWARGEANGDR